MATLRTNYQEGDILYASDINDTNREVNGKVNKEAGKGLSENDYTDEEKEKVENSIQKNSVTWGDLMPL